MPGGPSVVFGVPLIYNATPPVETPSSPTILIPVKSTNIHSPKNHEVIHWYKQESLTK